MFCDHGLEAPLEEIARRAGVGIGTLYRRFPSRVELLDAVLADTVQAHVDGAERALAMEDPWDGFAYYLEQTCRLQAANRGLNDAMGMRFQGATAMEAAKARLFDVVAQVVDRAPSRAGSYAPTSPWKISPSSAGPHPHPAGLPRRGRTRRLAATPRPPAGRLPRRPCPPAATAATGTPTKSTWPCLPLAAPPPATPTRSLRRAACVLVVSCW